VSEQLEDKNGGRKGERKHTTKENTKVGRGGVRSTKPEEYTFLNPSWPSKTGKGPKSIGERKGGQKGQEVRKKLDFKRRWKSTTKNNLNKF